MYGEETPLLVNKIRRIYTATNSISDVDWLDSDTAYSISRIFSQTEAIIKEVDKFKNKLYIELSDKVKETNNLVDEEERKKKIKELNEEYSKKFEDTETKEEKVGIVKFKLSNFTCKEPFKTVVKLKDGNGKIIMDTKEFKKGQILVPQIFLNLMGDLIEK